MSDTASSTRGDINSEEGNTSGGGDIEYSNVYERTNPVDWTCIAEGDGQRRRSVAPIEYTGTDDLFSSIITDDEINNFKDASGDIRFDKVLEYTLPLFGENDNVSLFEW